MPSKKHKIDEKSEEDVKPMEQPVSPAEPTGEPEVLSVISEEEITELRCELEKTQGRADEYLAGWQRERAEFINYKKRIEREQSQGGQNAIVNAMRRYLDIADDLARALKDSNRPTEGNGAVWAEGIDLIHRKLVAAFEADGVKVMDAKGKFFDPNMHEAISHEDSPEHESGQIIDVVQPGYTLGERVIRPARVRVAR
jgi:molecular chaperone GrpE